MQILNWVIPYASLLFVNQSTQVDEIQWSGRNTIDVSNCIINEPLQITMNIYGSRRALNKAFKKNKYTGRHQVVDGFATWTSIAVPRRCSIYVQEIKSLTDENFSTWGHELMHCVCGEFHEQGKR